MKLSDAVLLGILGVTATLTWAVDAPALRLLFGGLTVGLTGGFFFGNAAER